MGDMLSIGEIAHRTGVSRRRLRHWEEIGLLEPDSVDEFTGYRRYARSQTGRVRAIASLRILGFGLDAIAGLLDSRVDEAGLVQLLRDREAELVAQIDEASTSLTEVRTRLAALEKGSHLIMNALELGPLPPLQLAALQTTVRDETEIPDAVAELRPRCRALVGELASADVELVLTYDGTSDDAIVVTVGFARPATLDSPGGLAGLDEVTIEGTDQGVSVTFDTAPTNIGDAWIALDTQLEERGQQTTGVYRQVLSLDGRVRLEAPIRSLR